MNVTAASSTDGDSGSGGEKYAVKQGAASNNAHDDLFSLAAKCLRIRTNTANTWKVLVVAAEQTPVMSSHAKNVIATAETASAILQIHAPARAG